eukprot:COSAG05_NODE_26386_length_188_cov_130.134831_1_plen_34_part_10
MDAMVQSTTGSSHSREQQCTCTLGTTMYNVHVPW